MPRKGRLVGIDEKLTVRSRDRECRVDLWFEMAWDGSPDQWKDAFDDVAASAPIKENAVDRLECFPFIAQRGWIVARGVEQSAVSATDLEISIRVVVDEANALLCDPRPTARVAAERTARRSWGAGVLGGLFSIAAQLVTTG